MMNTTSGSSTEDLSSEATADSKLTSAASLPPLLSNVMTLRGDLKWETRVENDHQFVVIEDPVRSKFFRIGEAEYRIISLVDGHRDGHAIAQIATCTKRASESEFGIPGALGVDVQPQPIATVGQVEKVMQWLLNSNLVVADRVDNGKRLNRQAESLDRAKAMGWLNPISIKVPIGNPNRWFKRLVPLTQWMFSTPFVIMWVLLGLYALATLFNQWDRLGESSVGILSGYQWIWLLVTWLVLKVVHEAAHGIACRRYGGEVPETGILFLLFTPMAYVNVTSMWRFPNRWHRMVVSAAGMYVELLVSFLAIIVWSQTNGVIASVAFNVFMMSSVTTILFNANPLMRFDGYFLLSDALAIPNLYNKGTRWFSSSIQQLCLGIENRDSVLPERERIVVKVYGVLAYFWKISISISLILGASVLFQGAGLLMSLVAIILWFAVPAYRQWTHWLGREDGPALNWRRVAITGLGIVSLGVAAFWWIQAPASQSAPAIVQFSDEQIIRASADGFIREVLVCDGASVTAGQQLVRLENVQLQHELFELECGLKEAEIQTRIYRDQRDQASVQSEINKCKQMRQQLKEKRAQVEGLVITAPFDGFVFERNLTNRQGSFVRQGDVLIRAARRHQKEVVVSVDQRDYDSATWQLSERSAGIELPVLFPGLRIVKARLVSVDPKAVQAMRYPTLTAAYGGSLPVQPVSDDQSADDYELLMPRFHVTLALSAEASAALNAGQRGSVCFSTTEQSMGSYLLLAIEDWVKSKLNMATAAQR